MNPEVKGVSFVAEAGGIEEYLLEANGLRILLAPDASAPVAAVMVSYRVGGRNEVPGFTGLAHMLEHMLFKGTDFYHKRRGTQISMLLENAGAVLNANTSHDATNYYEMLPSDKIRLALDIEAARMRGSLIEESEFEAEKAVVENELERYYDSPEASLNLAVWREAFKAHPYRFPVIGEREEVASMPAAKLRAFYDTYYWPNNAVLTVVGDFERKALLQLAAEKFSRVSRSPDKIPQEVVSEPAQKEVRRVTLQKESGAEYLMLAHKAPEGLHPDTPALDLLAVILSQGKTSRLYRALVDQGLAVDVAAGGTGTRDPGLFTTALTLAPGVKHEKAEAAVREVYTAIIRDGVTVEEVEQARHQLLAEASYARDGVFASASEIAHALAMGDWRHFALYSRKIESLTPETLKAAAARYWKDDTLTVGVLQAVKGSGERPASSGGALSHDHGSGTAGPSRGMDLSQLPADIRPLFQPGEGVTSSVTARLREAGTPNWRLLMLPTGVREVVTVSGYFRGGGNFYSTNPVTARLTSHMLDKGTRRHSKHELAALLEARGAHMSFGADHENLHFHVRCLKKDAPFILELLGEELREPVFDAGEFSQLLRQETVHLQYAMASTGSMGFNAFTRAIFPKGHPYAAVPYEEQKAWLEKTTAEDLRRFHQTYYWPEGLTLAAAGDLEMELLEKAAGKAFDGWTARMPERPPVKEPSFEAPASRETVTVPGRVKMDVYMGHAMKLLRTDPDYLAVHMANSILGGDFSARLSNTVRDVYGLTYGIRSGLMGMTHDLYGAWMIHMIVNPGNLEAGIERTREELDAFVRRGVTAKELGERQKMVAGKFQVALATTHGLADQIRHSEEAGLGKEYLDRFPALIRALTLDQVNEAIGRYYHPDRLRIVVAGNT